MDILFHWAITWQKCMCTFWKSLFCTGSVPVIRSVCDLLALFPSAGTWLLGTVSYPAWPQLQPNQLIWNWSLWATWKRQQRRQLQLPVLLLQLSAMMKSSWFQVATLGLQCHSMDQEGEKILTDQTCIRSHSTKLCTVLHKHITMSNSCLVMVKVKI